MKFDLISGNCNIPKSCNIGIRNTVKGIIFKDDNILMIKTNEGDYQFPGGGLEEKETKNEALIREVREETGYKVTEIYETIGRLTVNRKKSDNEYFVINSEYIRCNIDIKDKIPLKLDKREKMLDFKAEFVSIYDAYENNIKLLKNDNGNLNTWIYKETEVLKQIIDILNKKDALG